MNEQAKLWNGRSGRAWVDQKPLLDAVFRPIEELLAQRVKERRATNVLDVGCGTGSTTLAIARATQARVTGVDISEPMLAVARERAAEEGARASFIVADAQTHAFEPATFDMIVSRFGVMFFADPTAAFANLRRAAKDDAALALVAFRSPAENPFMTTAERAAAPLLPNIPARRPDGPGQFAFADASRVRAILEASGWPRTAIEPIDFTCTFPERELTTYFTRLGPLGALLEDVDDTLRAEVVRKVRDAFEPYVVGDEVRFTAACWLITDG